MIDPEKVQTRIPSVMEDPSAKAVARTYAESFLNAAKNQGVEAGLEEFESFLADVLQNNPEFEKLLLSGLLGRDDKVKLIDRIVAPLASPIFTSFLKVLARHDRLQDDFLTLVFDQSQRLHELRSGRKRVKVTSAKPLSESTQEQVRHQINVKFSIDSILEVEVRPEILGGLIIRIDDTVYDSSLATRLKQLRSRLSERSLHEIQSGRNRFSHPEGD